MNINDAFLKIDNYDMTSGHAFVGSGRICGVTLIDGGMTDGQVEIFDTDVASVLDDSNRELHLRATASNEAVDAASVPIHVTRGCYVQLTGVSTRALIKIDWAKGYSSDGAIRTVGSRYRRHPMDTELVTES